VTQASGVSQAIRDKAEHAKAYIEGKYARLQTEDQERKVGKQADRLSLAQPGRCSSGRWTT